MSRIYALANQKGGVGKTTTAVNLAACLAASGQHVLIVDVDPQSNATASLGVDKRKLECSTYDAFIGDVSLTEVIQPTRWANLELAPSSPQLAGAEIELVEMRGRETKLRAALRPVRDRYDYVFVDCPPSLGLLTVNALAASDGVIIPLECEYFALRGVALLMDTIARVQERINPRLEVEGILATMYDARTLHGREVLARVVDAFGDKVFRTVIARTVRFPETTVAGEPITTYASSSTGAAAYRQLAREVLAR